jgi:hypothetical protein
MNCVVLDVYGREHPVLAVQRAQCEGWLYSVLTGCSQHYTSLNNTIRKPYFTVFFKESLKDFVLY